jgi:hypothetical protein
MRYATAPDFQYFFHQKGPQSDFAEKFGCTRSKIMALKGTAAQEGE